MTQQTDDDTFTLREMREAHKKAMRGEPLTEKEKRLAGARQAAVKATCAPTPEEDHF